MEQSLYTEDEVASYLKVTPIFVRRAARAGLIPHSMVGRSRRFTQADIDAYLARTHRDQGDPWARPTRAGRRRSA